MRKIWLLIQENSLPEHGMLNRHANFAKYLPEYGYQPVVVVASKTRCSQRQMITSNEPFVVDESHGFPFVYIRVNDYGDSMKKRLVAIVEYHLRLIKHSKELAQAFGIPDVVLGSSNYPITPTLAIKLAKRFHAKSICEIRDLWPLSLEEYGIIKRGGLIAKAMYVLERYNYRKSDAIIFTMAGGASYIVDKKWDIESGGDIDLSKVFHINNGVDLETFERNTKEKTFCHPALEPNGRAKLVYAGSIRKANGLGFIVDLADEMKSDPVDFIIMGDGGERAELEKDAERRGLSNIWFIGNVDKPFIPSALSRGTLMLLMYSASQSDLSKYGMSQNKLFDYLASGKPVISNLPSAYSIVNEQDCGIERSFDNARECAQVIRRMLSDHEKMDEWSKNSRKAALAYSFRSLAGKLASIVDSIVCPPRN